MVVAFTFQDLNVMIIRELAPYNILTFLSETGGFVFFFVGNEFELKSSGSSTVNIVIFLIKWLWGLRINEQNWITVQNEKEEDDKWKQSINYCSESKINNLNEEESQKFIDNFAIL